MKINKTRISILKTPTAHRYGNIFFFKGLITFSSKTSKAWSVKSLLSPDDVMDKFIKITLQKKKPPPDATNIHGERIEYIRQCLEANTNVFIYGACGSGKTYIREHVLDETNSVELTPDLLRAKSLFSKLIEGSTKHLFIEDYEPDNLSFKGVVEKVSDGHRLTNGSLVVLSTHLCLYPGFTLVEIPRHGPEELRRVCLDQYDEQAAVLCRGNIRDYMHYLSGSDMKDVFENPKEVIYKILCDPSYTFNADKLYEHGHMWSIFQENYLDSKKCVYAKIAKAFSDADMFDCAMYSNDCSDWNMMPFFGHTAVAIPRYYMNAPLVEKNIRPGSCWTKNGNRNMRMKKLKNIQIRNFHMSHEALCVLQKYAGFGYIEPMLLYDITPQDFDTINHLCVGNKLKPRDVNTIKKKLKNALLEQGD
jgi:hypothetical protein